MNLSKFIIFIFCSFFPLVTFAFFCPTNFSQIEVGASLDQVTQICGKPDKLETKEVEGEGPQEWSYFIPQTVGVNSASSLTPLQGTLKTQITFDSENKAVNISVNGIGVGSSTICGTMIQLGDSRETIKSACGNPSFVNKQNGSPDALGKAPANKKVTKFFYNTTPPVTLIFENGVLKERQD